MPSTLDDYEVIGIIGSGSYGTCRRIRRKRDGKMMVWKELDYGTMSDSEKQMLVSEVNLLRELKHEHIVRYHDRIIDRSSTTLYIVMEYCEGGDLASLINKLKHEGRHIEEDHVWRICVQVASALKECHSRQKNGKAVLHRDLKPANIFLDASGNVKLGDFGLARVLNHDTSFAQTFVGTPYYMSPEQMNYMSYNEKSDIWALGCLLYELCALRPPFTAVNQRELTARIRVGRFTRLPLRYSEDLNAVISNMLRVDEIKRPSIEDILDNQIVKCHTVDRRTSGGSDEGYHSEMESLKKLKQALQEKERELKLKENELETREKTLVLREKVASERMARGKKLLEEAESQKALLAVNLNSNTPGSSKPRYSPKISNILANNLLTSPTQQKSRVPTPPSLKTAYSGGKTRGSPGEFGDENVTGQDRRGNRRPLLSIDDKKDIRLNRQPGLRSPKLCSDLGEL